MAYYRSMYQAPRPALAVIEDLDWPDTVGAFWGEINATIHKGFGLSGVLTNGVVRDLGDLPPDFPIIAGRVGPSHAYVHVRNIGDPVNVFGLPISQGDLVHADQHGAVVIPVDLIQDLGAAIVELQRVEKLVLGPARQPGFDFNAFEKAWAAFEAART